MFSHLRGRYAVQQCSVRFFLRIIDAFLSCIFRPSHKSIPTPVQRILLVHQGHLGDAVVLTALLDSIHGSFPGVEIGVVTGSWNRVVLEDNQQVRKLYYYDYWRRNRKKMSLLGKVWIQCKTAKQTIFAVRANKYDIAVVLSPFFGNGVILTWLMGVKVRIGYDCGGFGALLTHPIPGPKTIRHMALYHTQLLEQIDGFVARLPLRPQHLSWTAIEGLPDRFALIGIGAGEAFKKWPIDKWAALVMRFQHKNMPVVLVGSGAQEQREAQMLLEQLTSQSGVLNLCDQLTWGELVFATRQATIVVCHDSVIGHVASCFERPTAVLFSGVRSAIDNFFPLNPRARCLSKKLPCNPCFTVERGCKNMACIRELSVDAIWSVCQELVDYRDLSYREGLDCCS